MDGAKQPRRFSAESESISAANLTLSQFVDAVVANIQAADGADLSAQKAALVALGTRGAVMYRIVNDDLAGGNGGINNRAFIDAEYNRSFVASEYFGYLRRDADIGGFIFWLGQVNRFPVRSVSIQHANGLLVHHFSRIPESFRLGRDAH